MNTASPSIVVFADSEVGMDCVEWLVDNYKSDLAAIVTADKNEISKLAKEASISTLLFTDESSYLEFANRRLDRYDLGILLWWPKIIKPSIIASAKLGFVNTHPSLLPHNRGKHPNFWALVEQCPFGVSLHFVDDGIDCGDLVAQKKIDYTWEDTGETLYKKAITEMKNLFSETYPELRKLSFALEAQDLDKSSIHYAGELEAASKISLNAPTTPRHLLNLLRARTFKGHPACYFEEDGVVYEIRIEISKAK